MSTPKFNFKRGGDAAEAATKAQGGSFAKTTYFSLKKDGDQAIIRILTDDPQWFYVKQHLSAPTKNADPGVTFPWPAQMPAVCRYDEGFEGFYKDCYICDAGLIDQWDKPCRSTVRVWVLACLREEIIEDGVKRGYRDQSIEIDEKEKGELTGKKVKQRAIVVVNMGMKNFFNGLHGLYGLYNTVCDRDYVIKRSGSGKDTDYHTMPLDPISDADGRFTPEVKHPRTGEILFPEHPQWKRYQESIDQQGLDLATLVGDRASDEYFSKFFDPSKPFKWGSDKEDAKASDDGAPVSQQQVAPQDEPDAERLAEMRARLQGYSSAAPATSEPEAVRVAQV